MAKGFSGKEKEVIREKLMDAAEACWGRSGIKKTSVDDLVRMVNISKGSFYLFYPSKEHLFMDVFERIEVRTKAELFNIVQTAKGSGKEIFISVIKQMFNEVKKTPWILNVHNSDLELLLRKLPAERVEKHLKNDDGSVVELFRMLGIDTVTDPEVISGVMRSVFLLLLHKQEIGEKVFDEVMAYLIDAVAIKLFEGVKEK
ncbi:MAG: TetR/AcrR family transcriptional regulator [Clostridiaceae bacterium]